MDYSVGRRPYSVDRSGEVADGDIRVEASVDANANGSVSKNGSVFAHAIPDGISPELYAAVFGSRQENPIAQNNDKKINEKKAEAFNQHEKQTPSSKNHAKTAEKVIEVCTVTINQFGTDTSPINPESGVATSRNRMNSGVIDYSLTYAGKEYPITKFGEHRVTIENGSLIIRS